MTTIQQTALVSSFSCQGDRCDDTCCQNWSMQVDDDTRARYAAEAPELLEAIEQDNALWIMRKNPVTNFCTKLEDGFCSIHKQYGSRMLGDACHFYPRVTRSLGQHTLMTATMSCPEIVRLALTSDAPCTASPTEVDRLPATLKGYLPEGMNADEAMFVHRMFLAACDDANATPERIYARIARVARQLSALPPTEWARNTPAFFATADQQLPIPVANALDPFNLLHALCGLIVASQKLPSLRLVKTIKEMESALQVKLDWVNVLIDATNQSISAHEGLQMKWQQSGAALHAPVLRRWLQMQMSVALFPFAGLGDTLEQRITIIGVRMATIKLALMSAYGIVGGELSQEVLVRIIQSLSRFLDHLGDAGFSLQIYAETGWDQESRMRGLLDI